MSITTVFMTAGTEVLAHVVAVARMEDLTITEATVDALTGRVMVRVDLPHERRALARLVLAEMRSVYVPSRDGGPEDVEHFEGPHRDRMHIPVSVYGSLPVPVMSTPLGRAL